MKQLKMHSVDKIAENIDKIASLFPNCITESTDGIGGVKRTVDFDMLKQELSDHVVEGLEERYQFTWPDKKKAMLAANAPINKTLRPCREESVDFDNTENLYIEGDNLEVLKLLQETYLGKVKMIYIDPPYNTGNDFVYNDDFAKDAEEYMANSGQYSDEGNRLVANTESNGRFHTDWLNMMYPRLKLAKDLLSDDGLVFVSIGDEEIDNLRKIMDEVFGPDNFRNQIVVRRGAKSVQAQFETWDKLGKDFEYVLFYSRVATHRFKQQSKLLDSFRAGTWNNHWRGTDRPTMRYELFGTIPKTGQWRWSKERSEIAIINYNKMLNEIGSNPTDEQIDNWYLGKGERIDLLRLSNKGKPEHYIPPTDKTLLNSSWMDMLVGSSSEISSLFNAKVFETAKLTSFIKRILGFCDEDSVVLDFFSGSATTAHAVMQLNAEDGGHRKFIMVQLPEACDEKSEAFKAGYKNICEIGKERIRRAGKKIKDENPLTTQDLDIGFRVLKLDSSNMEDVYYTPKEYMDKEISLFVDNVKADRSSEDLLFQVMLDLGTSLSSKIVKKEIAGKEVFDVANGHIMACFDKDVNDDVITAIAKEKPSYFVMRDNSLADDSVAINFEQIFNTYSPNTERRVL
ncbi:MAG: site-specific DNA-methyltransferase [Elusimicrobiales bacterium]|nr:site-specific DNA-methyltransferase [Elusimicrobiales bacterium]